MVDNRFLTDQSPSARKEIMSEVCNVKLISLKTLEANLHTMSFEAVPEFLIQTRETFNHVSVSSCKSIS